jgi:pimeloyl-ACP methyl ester carboxylesterase
MQIFPQSRVTLSTGVSLDVVDIGPKDAPVLIFLHGFPESHRTWREQLGYFSTKFRCIAPDQRGYCRSDKPDGADQYTPDKLTADVFALADACGVDKFTVVGHDWGGAIVWIVALHGQNMLKTGNTRVERAVILNAPHPIIFQKLLIENIEQRASSQYIRAFRDPANDALVAEHGLVGLLLRHVKWDRSPAMTDDERDHMMADWREPGAAVAMLNWYRGSTIEVPAMDDANPPRPALLDFPFPTLAIPTLVIWAMDDLALPACNLDGLDTLVADLTIERVHGCGHFVPWEAPQAVNAAMDAWLNR